GPTFRAENSNTSRHLAEFWMIEPEIAFADLADNAASAEALLKYSFAALLNESQEDLAFFDQRIEKGLVAKTRRDRRLGIRAYGLRRGDRSAQVREREIRVPGQVGRRPAVGARALSDREIREEAGHRDELPEGHQSLLRAAQRRRPHRRGNGRIGAGDRRDHRRQPARGAARSIGPQHGGARHRPGALRLVPRPAPLRHGAARRLRPRLRAHPRLRHRPRQRARRDPLPANARQRAVLRHPASALAPRQKRPLPPRISPVSPVLSGRDQASLFSFVSSYPPPGTLI